jgi:hypothetical protein
MSIVALNGFFTYSRTQVPQTVVLSDVPLPARQLAPAGGLTTLYGFRDALEELSRLRQRWENDRIGLSTVTLSVEIGAMPYGRVSTEKLPQFRFLYLDRINRALEEMCRRYFETYAAESSISLENPFRHAGFVCQHPDFIGRLHQEPEFKHLDVIVYRIDDPQYGPRQVATLFNRDAVVKIEARGVETNILIPDHVAGRAQVGGIERVHDFKVA